MYWVCFEEIWLYNFGWTDLPKFTFVLLIQVCASIFDIGNASATKSVMLSGKSIPTVYNKHKVIIDNEQNFNEEMNCDNCNTIDNTLMLNVNILIY